MTTYIDKNPSFLVLEIDEEFMIPVSFKTYYLNITKANTENQATWELLIDYKDHYQMEDMSPQSFYQLAETIRVNETVAIEFGWNRFKKGNFRKSQCDRNCR